MNAPSPRRAGFVQPAEWTDHEACWLAWPSHADLWLENLPPVREAVRELVRAITDPDPKGGAPRGERVELLVLDEASEQSAAAAFADLPVRLHRIPFGDVWLRDTAPVFVKAEDGRVAPVCFRFNGWGEKYVLPHDADVAEAVAATLGKEPFRSALVLEGGSVEVDGEGTILTTTQCLLNPNRNPTRDRAFIEAEVCEALGGTHLLWLGDGLLNDHTDGHVDTVARFVAPGVVVCMAPSGDDDPNREALETMARDLSAMRDAKGRKLEVVRIPSPGLIEDEEGRVMPASYVNFYIANTAVIVPTYGAPWDDEAVEKIGKLFPTRRAVGVRARELLSGGGAFHCITQQQPRAGGR